MTALTILNPQTGKPETIVVKDRARGRRGLLRRRC